MENITSFARGKEAKYGMTRMEMKMRIQRRKEIEKRFSEKFPRMKERDDTFVALGSEGEFYFRVDEFPGEFALVIEYAEKQRDAIRGIFGEDGDRFYLEDMNEDEMFEAMLKEVGV